MKTRDVHWYDLFERRGTRRDFLRVAGSVAGMVALGAAPAGGGARRRASPLRDLGAYPFTMGIASGDPTPDGVVLWTRLAPEVLELTGAHRGPTAVRWEVAEDERFRRIVRSGEARARPELGHTVHAEVSGLRPGRAYFYRLMAGGAATPVGRTRTAPAPDASIDRFRFAFASCQHYEHGYYTAYDHMAREELDLVVHLGDYIYEGGIGRGRVRQHDGPEVRTLQQYRHRYATYRADPDLQAAHAAAPWVVTWDDHEVDNNYADGIAEDAQSPEAFLLRRAAAYQAYYEFMPLRASSMPSGPRMRLYRRLPFGRLLDLYVLDTRQYRDDQPCGDGRRPTCPDHRRPDRTILGDAQREWLLDGLASGGARWNVLAQQVLMARLAAEDATGEDTFAMDMWDGYPVERRNLLDFLARARPSNPVVLTGDIHSSWVADLRPDFDAPDTPAVATEFAGTSISSGGNGAPMTERGAGALAANPHLHFYDGRRGYVHVTVTPELWTSAFRTVATVTEGGAPRETAAVFVVESGQAGARRG